MNSSDLLRRGFRLAGMFHADIHQQVPNAVGVYALRLPTPFRRLLGETDVAYIGSATFSSTNRSGYRGLRMRIYQYFHPGSTQGTNKRVMRIIKHIAPVELLYWEALDAPQARGVEKQLLDRYETEHAELPPLNRSAGRE